MSGRRVAVTAGLVLAAVTLQAAVLSRLPLPGATPDLVLLVVVALALAWGPAAGSVTGFAAGLALDLAPPADHPAGTWAFVLTLLGHVAGHAAAERERSVLAPLAVVALAAAAAALLFPAVAAAGGDPRVGWAAAAGLLPTAVLYDVLLAPFVLPGILALARRAGPGPARR